MPMKVLLIFADSESNRRMTLRFSLPKRFVSGPTKDVVKLFVDHYNRKYNALPPLVDEDLHLKIIGGGHLDRDALVSETLCNGVECHLLYEDDVLSPANVPEIPATPRRLRCKRFGCNRFYDPAGPPQECIYHVKAPVNDGRATSWMCCPDRKAFDYDAFFQIAGCTQGYCSANPNAPPFFPRCLTLNAYPVGSDGCVNVICTNMAGDEIASTRANRSEPIGVLRARIAEEVGDVFHMLLPNGRRLSDDTAFLADVLSFQFSTMH